MNLIFLLSVTVLVLLVLAWLMWPLLRTAARQTRTAAAPARVNLNAAIFRDQLAELERDRASGALGAEDFAQAQAELQRRLLEDAALVETAAAPAAAAPAKRTALTLGVLLPVIAALLYVWLGNPAAVQIAPGAEAGAARHQISVEQIESMIAKLAAHQEQNPEDLKGWALLARSYRAMGRLAEAENAYERAASLVDRDPTMLAEYADLLAERAKGNLEGRPLTLVKRALALDPDHMLALALAGTAAYNRKDYAETLTHWERLVKLMPPESEDAQALTATLMDVRNKAAAGAGADAGREPARKVAENADGKAATLSGKVSLAPELAGKVKPDDTLFIYARAVAGPRMPLAVLRARAGDLPLAFTLDDSLAIAPDFKLSGAKQVKVEVRVSKSGNATPNPGDLLGESPVLQPGAKHVNVLIDRVQP